MTLAKFLRTGAAALGALAVATQVNAADIYSGGGMKDVPMAPPPPLWTGFYAGIHLGAAWVDHKNDRNRFYDRCYNGGDGCWIADNNVDPWYSSDGAQWGGNGDNQTVAFGGGQFGFNWMPYGWTSVVLGIEVDIDGIGNSGERTYNANGYGYLEGDLNSPYPTSINTIRVKRDGGFAGDVTGRIGWTWGPAMIYAKGGFAWLESNLKVRATHCDLMDGVSCTTFGVNYDGYGDWNNNKTLTGWTVGGGVEWLLNPNWSVKIEYLHFDFSNGDNNNWNPNYYYASDSTHPNNYNNWRFRNDVTADTVKLGINYHLTSAPVAAPLK
jgi:outer membrane immunogenic protein